jgi:predicted AAA+ superfamily ATPase
MNYLKRCAESLISTHMDNRRAIFILGPRQVGKTTLLKHLMEVNGYDNSLYYDIERQENLTLFSGSLEGIIAKFRNDRINHKSRICIFIDEIQNIPDFSKTIKLLVDHYSEEFKLILTGSSSSLIRQQFQESLTGRKIEYILYPLSFPEFCLFKQEEKIAELLDKGYRQEEYYPLHLETDKMKTLMAEYIVFGGYPEVVLQNNDKAKAELLNEIASTYILKDIRHIFQIERIDELNRLIRYLAINIGKEMNLNKISVEAGLKRPDVQNYVKVLESSYIISQIIPFYSNPNNELRKMPKSYFLDLGIRNILINNLNSLDMRTDKGELFENMVFLNLLHKQDVLTKIQYWKNKYKQEIDFVVSRADELSAYEVKYGSNTDNHFTAFTKTYPQAKCRIVRFNYSYKENELPGYF